MGSATDDTDRRLLRARNAMDRACAEPLDVPILAALVHVPPAHVIRTVHATFGETSHGRRVERGVFPLRTTERSVTDVCMAVGFSGLGTSGRVVREVVGELGSRAHSDMQFGRERWLTVVPPGQPTARCCSRSRAPSRSGQTAVEVRQATGKGVAGNRLVLVCDDPHRTHAELRDSGH